MTTYFLIEVLQVKDAELYKRYAEAARAVIEEHHGEYIIRSNNITLVSGATKPERVILIRFPSPQHVTDCFNSPAYRQLAPLRKQATESRAFVIDE